MQKFSGWLTIIICSIFLLIFGIAIIAIMPNLLTGRTRTPVSSFDTITIVATFAIVIALFIFGLIWGIKKVKKEKPIETIDFPEIIDIKIKGQIEYRDYRNLILRMTFRKPFYLVFLAIMFLFFLSFLNDKDEMTNHLGNNYFTFIFFGVVTLTPIFTLFQIKNIYKTHKVFHEHIEYNINNDIIHIKGNTFNSILRWNHFYKIKETKDFFLFYQRKVVATLLDKRMFNTNDIEQFRNFIKSLNLIRE